jgi:hypothetical protein
LGSETELSKSSLPRVECRVFVLKRAGTKVNKGMKPQKICIVVSRANRILFLKIHRIDWG